MPIIYRCIGWFVAWFCLFFIGLFSIYIELRITKVGYWLSFVYLTLIFSSIASSPVRTSYREEQSELLEGDIYTVGQPCGDRITFETGRTGKLIIIKGGPERMIDFGPDMFLELHCVDKKIYVSTTVSDRTGQIVAQMIDNHWILPPKPSFWDKNYNKNALEVEDKSGHVVFQVVLLPDRVQIQGEWHDSFGHAVLLEECRGPYNEVAACITSMPNQNAENDYKSRSKTVIRPLYKYPSKEHWGELDDRQ